VTGARGPLLAVATGAALGLYAIAIAVWVPDALTLPAPVHVAIGWAFVGAGTVAWLRRPNNRTGRLMTVAGLVWFGRDFDWIDGVFTAHLDAVASNLFIALVAHLLVVFPDGHARTRAERVLVGAAYLVATVGYLITLLGPAANAIVDVAAGAVAAAILARLVRRWRSASPPARRILAPVVWTGPVVLAVVLVMLVLDSGGPWSAWLDAALHWAALAFTAIPLAFLVGLLRTRLHRGVLSDLIVELSGHPSPPEVRAALARALGDPALEVAYWLPAQSRYVDLNGQPAKLDDQPTRSVTVLDHDGQPIAALIHDPSLLEEPDLVHAAAAAAQLALENARLQAELRPSCKKCGPHAPGSCPPGTPKGAASNAICTTAPSSGCWGSDSRFALRAANSAGTSAPSTRCCPRPRPNLPGRSRTSARWPAASIPRSLPKKGWHPPCRRSRAGQPSQSPSRRCQPSGCRQQSRRRPTTSPPKPSPTSPSTPTPGPSHCPSPPPTAD
jgi:hypothetical protein